MFWITLAIAIVSTVCILVIRHLQRDKTVGGTPVYVGTSVESDESSQTVDIVCIVSKHMVRALRNAGYIQQGDGASITLVMQSSFDDIKELSDVIAYSHNSEELSHTAWVVVRDNQRQVLHLGKAVNFIWSKCERGAETKP